MKKTKSKTVLLLVTIVVLLGGGGCLGWYYLFMRDAVPSRKITALSQESRMTEAEVRGLLGTPNWTSQRDGETNWEYWREFAGIRTDLTLHITLSNGVMVSWHQMD